MNITIIGGTGFVGTAVLQEALERGHLVTAILRHPEKIGKTHPNLTIKQGDVMDTAALPGLLKGTEIVISAYNPGWTNPQIHDEFLKGYRSIQESVKQAGVSRLIVVGGAGSLYIAPGQQIIDTPGFPEEWKPGASAAREYLDILSKETDLDWTFLSPAVEMHQGTSGVRTGKYRTGLDSPVFDAEQRSVISVEDVAVALLDEVENPKHIKQRFTIGY